MATLRDQMLDAIQAALLDATDAKDRVYRTRRVTTVKDSEPAILVLPYKEDTDHEQRGTYTTRRFEARISVFARGEVADQAADLVCADAHAAIMADETLGGLALRCAPLETTWRFSDDDMDAVEVDCRYMITYTTRRASLTTRP